MNWLRAKLRNWLLPEVVDFTKTVEKAKTDLHDQVCSEIGVIKEMQRIAEERLDDQMGALFIKFPGHKQVAVKEAVKLLLKRHRLELAVEGELSPYLRTTRKPRKKA